MTTSAVADARTATIPVIVSSTIRSCRLVMPSERSVASAPTPRPRRRWITSAAAIAVPTNESSPSDSRTMTSGRTAWSTD